MTEIQIFDTFLPPTNLERYPVTAIKNLGVVL